MDQIPEFLSRTVEELLGRASGPLHFRLLMMPTVVTILAIRAGLRHAREGHPPFVWSILTNPELRGQFVLSAVGDIGRVFVVAIVLDTIYQLIALRTFHVGQALIVAVACAIVPYILIRGPVALLARALSRIRTGTEVAAAPAITDAATRESR